MERESERVCVCERERERVKERERQKEEETERERCIYSERNAYNLTAGRREMKTCDHELINR